MNGLKIKAVERGQVVRIKKPKHLPRFADNELVKILCLNHKINFENVYEELKLNVSIAVGYIILFQVAKEDKDSTKTL